MKSYGSEIDGIIDGYTYADSIYLENTKSAITSSTETTEYEVLLKRQDNEFEGFILDVIVEYSVEDFRNSIYNIYNTAVNH